MAILKPGRIVVVLAGKLAGKKAVVLSAHTSHSGDKRYSHVLVCGVARTPKKITRALVAADAANGTKKVEKRCVIKPFVKVLNMNHVMPTRFTLDVHEALKNVITDSSLNAEDKKGIAKNKAKAILTARYKDQATGKNDKAVAGVQYFFRKLKF